MHDLRRLRGPWLFSMCAAGLGLLGTLLIVWLAGTAHFAHYAIDLAKMSLVMLIFESVPSSYVIARSQQDEQLREDLASFCIVGALASLVVTATIGWLGAFSEYSHWMLLYGAYLAFQRYLDVRLQADGRVREYYQLTATSAALRSAFLGLLLLFDAKSEPANTIWLSLAVGSVVSLGLWVMLRPEELRPFRRAGHPSSLVRLYQLRRQYYAYYVNSALKRLRDATMPIMCGALIADAGVVGQYLLAFRGVDFVCGQLRVLESALANFAMRQAMNLNRGRQFVVLSMIGQVAAFVASAFLARQSDSGREVLLLSVVASFVIVPYLAEIVQRADAYSAFEPRRVTLSLACFIVTLLVSFGMLFEVGWVSAVHLMFAQFAAQCAAALGYRAFRPLR